MSTSDKSWGLRGAVAERLRSAQFPEVPLADLEGQRLRGVLSGGLPPNRRSYFGKPQSRGVLIRLDYSLPFLLFGASS